MSQQKTGNKQIDLLREEVDGNPESAKLRLKLGTALIKAQKYTEAEKQLRRALELDRACVGAWVNLGGILLGRFDFDGCVEANRKAIVQQPDALLAHYNKGLGHLYLDQAQDMVECFEKVVELDPDNAGGRYHLAVGLHALGRTHEAWQHYKRALDLGHAPQPDFIREMEKYEKKRNEGVSTVEMGPEAKE